jgi:hypothetical protein
MEGQERELSKEPPSLQPSYPPDCRIFFSPDHLEVGDTSLGIIGCSGTALTAGAGLAAPGGQTHAP